MELAPTTTEQIVKTNNLFYIYQYSLIMKLTKILSFCFTLILVSQTCAAQDLVPLPAGRIDGEGHFVLSRKAKIVADVPQEEQKLLTAIVDEMLRVSPAKQGGRVISLKSLNKPGDASTNVELQAYELKVTPDTIQIVAPSGMGVFYGLQTLRQLVIDNQRVRSTRITDKPVFRHRGFLLDCSRHFWSKEFIKKQMDAMAYFKLNRFHFHLVDGGGWRLEIDKYPELIEKSAYRSHWDWDQWIDHGRQFRNITERKTSYGGYYTKQDIRELVQYAKERYITIIPEIEMPGHNNEVMAVYPELSCVGETQTFRGFDLCVGNPKTFTFLTDVLTEVMELFPSEYIHVGGDEAIMMFWKKCPKCLKILDDNNFKDTIQIQSYLMTRIDSFLTSHGRRMLGWDEILDCSNLSKKAAIVSWRGEQGAIKAAKMGHHAVMAPSKYCYLDKYQGNPATEPKALGGYTPLDSTYSYKPMPAELKDTPYEKYIDGIQGNLWTEYIGTVDHAEYMIYPRLLAIAENGWGYATSFQDFKKRVITQIETLRKWGYRSFPIAERER